MPFLLKYTLYEPLLMYVIMVVNIFLTHAYQFFLKHFRNLKDIDMRQANRHSVNKRVPRLPSMEKIKFNLSSIGYSFYNDNT